MAPGTCSSNITKHNKFVWHHSDSLMIHKRWWWKRLRFYKHICTAVASSVCNLFLKVWQIARQTVQKIPAWRVVSEGGGTACSRLRMLHASWSIGLETLCVMWMGELRRCDSVLEDRFRGTLIWVAAWGLDASTQCTSLLLRGRRTRSFTQRQYT